jgi:hypothetical protein
VIASIARTDERYKRNLSACSRDFVIHNSDFLLRSADRSEHLHVCRDGLSEIVAVPFPLGVEIGKKSLEPRVLTI